MIWPLSLAGAILTGIALFTRLYFTEEGPAFALNGWGSTQLCVTAVLTLFYGRLYGKRAGEQDSGGFIFTIALDDRGRDGGSARWRCLWLTALSLLLALFCIFGKSYQAFDEWTLPFGGLQWALLGVAHLAGYFPLFYGLLSLALARLNIPLLGEKRPSRWTELLFEKHPILLPMAIILLCQLPYLYFFYPGILSCDADYQIGQIISTNLFTWHHPPFVTFLYGGFARLGILLGNGDWGVLLLVVLQSLLCAFVFGCVCACLKYLRAPYWLRYLTLAYYALLTVWPIFATTLIKDSLYYPAFTLYTVLLALGVKQPQVFGRRKGWFAAVFVTVLFMALVRNNGVYSFLLSFPFLTLLFPRKGKLAVLGVTLALLLSLSGFNRLWPKVGVLTFDILTDTYSVMYQQTARYRKYHGEEVTPEEYAVLNKIFEYDEQPERYEPQLSDPVKDRIRRESGLSAMTLYREEYFRVWWQQLWKHPATYLQAYLNGCYGYFYPDCKEYKEGLGWYVMWQFSFESEEFHPRFLEEREEGRRFLENLPEWLRDLPGIGLLYSCGFYTWAILIISVFLLVKKKFGWLIAYLPALSNILICTVSPVNAYVRYALPVFAVTPLLWGVLLATRYDRKKES